MQNAKECAAIVQFTIVQNDENGASQKPAPLVFLSYSLPLSFSAISRASSSVAAVYALPLSDQAVTL